MTENQSISKKERKYYQESSDLLSDLPLSIIHIILALVPIRDAVRTSVLSRQWRYAWTSLPHLVFQEQGGSGDYGELMCKLEERMENFITNVLFHHKGPIHMVSMCVHFRSRSPNINEWILCMARNDIKELILNVSRPFVQELLQVHSSIYSCEMLTNLKLQNCILVAPPPSAFEGFLFLRCLQLRNVRLSSNAIGSLVAHCPLLERFSIDETQKSKLSISSPNLKYLDIWGNYNELYVSAPLLAEMSVCLGYRDNLREQESSVCNYTDFMGGFTNLEKLRGDIYFPKYLSMGIEFCHQTLVFHQLKDIEFHLLDFTDKKSVSVVVRLIVGSPNLQKLDIGADYIKEADATEAPQLSFRDLGCAPDFTFEKLRVVVMSYVKGYPLQMEFIKFVLKSSPALETMNLRRDMKWHRLGFLPSEEYQKIMAFCRASPKAKLSFE